jgi:hypothetical protein
LGITSISQQQARAITRSRMQQNDSMPSGVMSVVVANVTPTPSPIVPIANATPNQPRNVVMTHASTNVAWPSATIV